MRPYALSIDDFTIEGSSFIERMQDGVAGHYCMIRAESHEAAVDEFLKRLKPFVMQQMYPSTDYGYPESGESEE